MVLEYSLPLLELLKPFQLPYSRLSELTDGRFKQ